MVETYFDKYNELSDAKINKMHLKYDPESLFVKTYNYDAWSENEELTDKEESVDSSDMPPLEDDEEEVKDGKGLKILTTNKFLARLPILLAQIKTGNNSYKLKMEIKQVLYLLYQHDKIAKKVYNNLIKSS